MEEKILTGCAWSSCDDMEFHYKITLTKENVLAVIKLMDTYKALKQANPDMELHELVAWDDCVEIFNDEECTDEQRCDVCKVRVDTDMCVWELKDKYCSNVYETMDITRSDLEDLFKEG